MHSKELQALELFSWKLQYSKIQVAVKCFESLQMELHSHINQTKQNADYNNMATYFFFQPGTVSQPASKE